MTTPAVIGIDIGGTTTSLGFVDATGTMLHEERLDTLAGQPATDLVARLTERITSVCNRFPARKLAGIGIGAPNANYYLGTVENPPNLKWGASVNLAELFRGSFPVPVAVTNDANAAALGELLFGGGKGMKHLIAITLGTGLGSGIVVNGELLYGSGGFAGELGHTTVDPAGRHCACGRQGCLEAYVSAPGLCRTVSELLAFRREESPLRHISYAKLTARQVYEAAVANDPIAVAAFDATAKILAVKLADAVAHTSPQAIFVSGGLANAGELLLAPARRYLEQFLFTPYKGSVRLLRSDLPEGNGAILGAAALAWQERSTAP